MNNQLESYRVVYSRLKVLRAYYLNWN